jgi:hypothetical protein
MPNRQEGQRLMTNLASTLPKTQQAALAEPQTEAMKTAVALWLLDLGITAAEARQWATADPEHPAASCLELIDVMESLAGASL